MKQNEFSEIMDKIATKRQQWIQSSIENDFKFDFMFQYNTSAHFITEL
jgi:hypothetical protein